MANCHYLDIQPTIGQEIEPLAPNQSLVRTQKAAPHSSTVRAYGEQMKRVFISYVREDSSQVERICEELQRAGIDYWLDKEQIKPGEFWPAAIANAIENGAFFLACFSRKSEQKEKSHMRQELYIAAKAAMLLPPEAKWIIPVKLTECQIPKYDIGGGRDLNQIHYFNLSSDWREGLKQIINTIKSSPPVIDNNPKHDLVYGIVHDIRNYLWAIEGVSAVAKIRYDNGANITENLEGLREYTSGLSEFINKILKSHS